MKQFEQGLGKVLSVVIVAAGIAFLVMWRQAESLKVLQTGLTVADARNTTLLYFIPGMLMLCLGALNLIPERLRPPQGTSANMLAGKILGVIILLGGIALLVMWNMEQKLVPTQVNLSVQEIRTPTLLLFVPGILFVGLGIVNLLPDSLRGIRREPEATPETAPAEDKPAE